MRSSAGRPSEVAAIVVAVVVWFGLALQFYVSADLMRANGHGWRHIVVRYFSYFTVLTNALVAVTVTAPLVAPRSGARRFFSLPTMRAAVAAYIALVGISYSLLLRHVWDPKGLARVSDSIQHDVVPVLYVLSWVIFERTGALRWSDALRWLIYPLIYVTFAIARGDRILTLSFHRRRQARVSGCARRDGVTRRAFLLIALVLLIIDRAMSRPGAKVGSTAA